MQVENGQFSTAGCLEGYQFGLPIRVKDLLKFFVVIWEFNAIMCKTDFKFVKLVWVVLILLVVIIQYFCINTLQIKVNAINYK